MSVKHLSAAIMLGTGVCWALAWQPARAPLMTKWAKDVSPDRAWPEYPRPQMVRSDWVNLNGLWQYAIRPKDEAQPGRWDGEILVPFAIESALSGVMKPLKPEERLWYRRTFKAPELPGGQRLILRFGAVDWQCTVWVNGTKVAEHTGGYDPFATDITDALKQGDNEIVVRVFDPTNTGWQPRGKQVLRPGGIMYTAVSGIWQTVWLEPVPARHVQSLKIVPDIDKSAVVVTVTASQPGPVTIEAKTDGKVVANASGQSGEAVALQIKDAKLWSPEGPFLYDLSVRCGDDTVGSYFGMRKIEVRKDANGINRLFLNNRVLFQYGPLDQGWWPDGLYTPPTDDAIQYDIRMTKAFGMNMARKHVKYEPARWYYWCDKMGLLVWQDMPAGDTGRNDESKADFLRELKAMIDTLRNFPCIVMWVPFNEGWGQHDTADIVTWIAGYDPTRPVNEASGWHNKGSGSVSDMHSYPGPGMRPVEETRAVVLGEFGGLGMPVRGHAWREEKSWGYVSFADKEALTDAYVGLLAAMRPLIGKGLSAAVYTQTSDVEVEVNGLMTYDRALVKMDLDRMAAAARKLYLPPPIMKTLVPTSKDAPQTWRYTMETPDGKWFSPRFDDSGWKAGPGGFGTKGTPGAVVRTEWKTPDIWIRRTFTLDEMPRSGDVSFEIHHDEDADVYINGELVSSLKAYTTHYATVPLNAKALKVLRKGENTLAIHCHQTMGGQYIDAGLVVLIEKE